MGSSTDKKDTGRLHVDFAQARDDLYEWECKQRMLAREERHRRRLEEERFHPPSPPPVVHYSDHECSIVAEKLKGKWFCGLQLPVCTELSCKNERTPHFGFFQTIFVCV